MRFEMQEIIINKRSSASPDAKASTDACPSVASSSSSTSTSTTCQTQRRVETHNNNNTHIRKSSSAGTDAPLISLSSNRSTGQDNNGTTASTADSSFLQQRLVGKPTLFSSFLLPTPSLNQQVHTGGDSDSLSPAPLISSKVFLPLSSLQWTKQEPWSFFVFSSWDYIVCVCEEGFLYIHCNALHAIFDSACSW